MSAAAARVPFKISVKVLDAPPAVVKADGSSTRHVVVAGGVSVMAPAHIKTGDTIVVRAGLLGFAVMMCLQFM